ncbi:MAG: glycosyltransferase, partial [Verrucomicrobiota bacterium]|nr:glycosyltransferase [Verrucomicrobiota bacterium]
FRGSHRLLQHPAVQAADLIHAHNLYGGYFHPFSLIALSHFRPVVWSTHDMQPLTGYCAHALDCTRWEIGCGQCPDLTKPGPSLAFDNTAALWRDKRLIAQNSRLWMVGASSWMAAQLRRSLWREHPIYHIANGIDTAAFHPIDRAEARRKMGLPASALIVGSLARGGVLAHPLKGGAHVRAVLETLHREHPEIIFLDLGGTAPSPEPWIRSLVLSSLDEVRTALSALDFFLYPTLADTAPLSVVEAMACGLPVVGFDVGGVPDFVTAGEGLLVPPNDTLALIAAARRLAADEKLRTTLGRAARARAVAHFDRTRMAASYEELYRIAIREHSPSGAPPCAIAAPHSLEEIRLLQGEMLGLESKLTQFRAKRAEDETELARLLRHPWLRLGLRLGLVRGSAKSWLRRRARQIARRANKNA